MSIQKCFLASQSADCIVCIGFNISLFNQCLVYSDQRENNFSTLLHFFYKRANKSVYEILCISVSMTWFVNRYIEVSIFRLGLIIHLINQLICQCFCKSHLSIEKTRSHNTINAGASLVASHCSSTRQNSHSLLQVFYRSSISQVSI